MKKFFFNIFPYTEALLVSYSEIFFLRKALVGFFLLTATFYNPNTALAGIIAVLSAFLFARFISFHRDFLKSGFYTYNPLLVGLGIGYLFKLSWMSIFFISCAGIFTFILTIVLAHVFSYYFKLPILSVPFVIVSSLVYLASSKYEALFISGISVSSGILENEINLVFWIDGFFKALGAIFFMPYLLPGIIVALIILCSSRIQFLFSCLGYYIGTLTTGILTGSFEHSFSNIFHFNYILIAVAIGSIFTIPSLRSMVIASIAVFLGAFLLKAIEVFWSTYGIPGFALPFNLITLSFIYALRIVHYPEISLLIKPIPEDTLDHFLVNKKRHSNNPHTIGLPFIGKWTVWQGFNGQWTHKGNLRYAYDFIITDEEQKSFGASGEGLSDYYAFNKLVVSPVRGRVIKTIDHLEDNPIGCTDTNHLWGNLIVIEDERGFFVEISHLRQSSLLVKEGQWLEKGQRIASCGNSGNSPQPHLHIQVQLTQEIAASTLPFTFDNYTIGDKLYINEIPQENVSLEPLSLDKDLEIKTSLVLDSIYSFDVFKKNKKIDTAHFKVKISSLDGLYYFSSKKGKLYFGKKGAIFYIYSLEGNDPHLRNLFIALPSLPLGYKENLMWKDYIPFGIFSKGIYKELMRFLSVFYRDLTSVKSQYCLVSQRKIKGKIRSNYFNKTTEVELSREKFIKSFKVDDYEYLLHSQTPHEKT